MRCWVDCALLAAFVFFCAMPAVVFSGVQAVSVRTQVVGRRTEPLSPMLVELQVCVCTCVHQAPFSHGLLLPGLPCVVAVEYKLRV